MWRRSKSARARFTGATLALVAMGCVRPPLDVGCVEVNPGDLVISELRGPQAGTDTRGQWIEIYNASPDSIPLTALQIVLRPLASSASTITVRDAQLSVLSGAYAVLAVDTTCSSETCVTRLPADADYGFGQDYTRDLPSGAIVELRACGQLVDSLLYRALPGAGTLALSGAAPPDADENDVASDDAGNIVAPFCADDEPNTPPGTETELGLPGTPGTANRVCP